MIDKTVVLLITVFVAALSGCGGGGSGSSADNSLDNDQWRSITNSGAVKSGIRIDGSSNILTVVNDSDSSVGVPSLSVYDFTTGQATPVSISGAAAVPAGSAMSGSFSFPGSEAPDDSALIVLYFGGDQAAVFVTAGAYADLSPAILFPGTDSPVSAILSAYIVPYSGNWNFQMNMSASYLSGTNCPSSSPTFTTSGETAFYVSNNAYSASWHADENVIAFNRSATSDSFESPVYFFAVEGDDDVTYGTNSWTLTPTSSSDIAGTLNWNNNLGCTAEYPITMEYQSPLTPDIFALCEGTWNINYSNLICGGNVIANPAALPGLPFPSGTLDVTYDPSGAPLSLSFDTLSSYQTLINVGGTNTYGSGFPSVDLGGIEDVFHTWLQLVGGFQMTAVSKNLIYGTVNLTGYGLNFCTGSGVFVMTGPGC